MALPRLFNSPRLHLHPPPSALHPSHYRSASFRWIISMTPTPSAPTPPPFRESSMDIRSRHQFPDGWTSRFPRPSITPGVWMDGRIAFLACKLVLELKQVPLNINTTLGGSRCHVPFSGAHVVDDLVWGTDPGLQPFIISRTSSIDSWLGHTASSLRYHVLGELPR